MRAVKKKPGLRGIAESSDGWFKLPEGMPNPCEVTIIEVVPEKPEILVEDATGARWSVSHWLVNCGYEFFMNARWVHESDPRVLKRLEASVNRRAAGYSTEFRETAERILKRNGRPPR